MASRPDPDLSRFLATLSQSLEAKDLPFMLIGGQAVLLHGQPRLTEDIDVTLGVELDRFNTVLEVCEELEQDPLPREVEPFVRETFVLPALHGETGLETREIKALSIGSGHGGEAHRQE
ncbi:MAG: nucleotidyl transferase AbiEii/AbiGii toxin family protein [Gemmatimonadota bacterium]